MKVSKESFEAIRKAVEQLDTPDLRKAYQSEGLSHRRYSWDLLHAAKGRRLLPERFICDLYDREDVNDEHIYTALRRAVKPF